MFRFLATFLVCFLSWSVLVASTAEYEMLTGILVSFIVALIARDVTFQRQARKLFDPRRWFWFILLIPIFIFEQIRAHILMTEMIITNRPKAAIVRVRERSRNPSARVFLANLITLTPGTLAVEADKGLYVHWMRFGEGKLVSEVMSKVVGGVAG